LGLGAVLGVLSASLPVVISEIVAYIAEHRFSQLKEAFQKHLFVGARIHGFWLCFFKYLRALV